VAARRRSERQWREEPLVSGLAELFLVWLGQAEGADPLLEARGVEVPQRLRRRHGERVQILRGAGTRGGAQAFRV